MAKKIKICGLSRREDIEAVNKFKPEFCGFIINFPKSRRSVTVEQLKNLTSALSPDVTPVGVFVDEREEVVAGLLNGGVIKAAQLHGHENEDYIKKLRSLTSHPIWQAFQIHSADDVSKAEESSADFVILDSGQGSGKQFDWSLLERVTRPFGLAGGINLSNLGVALSTNAELIDISGGVETDGVKDADKIKKITEEIRQNP